MRTEVTDVDSTVDLTAQPLYSWKLLGLLVLLLSVALVPTFWFIKRAATEITQYSAFSFEAYTREALAEEDYDHALQICSGAIATSLAQDEHWATAYLLAAQAHAGKGDLTAAVRELEKTARIWSERYYLAKDAGRREAAEVGRKLGALLLAQGDGPSALRAYSAGGVAGGDPAAFLHTLAGELGAEERATLWSDKPFLILEDFSEEAAIPRPGTEIQERAVAGKGIEDAMSATGGSSAFVELAPPADLDRLYVSTPVYLPISDQRFALRAYVRSEQPADLQLLVSYWFDAAHTSAFTMDPPAGTLEEGWLVFAVERDFHAERLAEAAEKGYAIDGGIISHIGVEAPPTLAGRLWFDRLDLYLP